MIAIVCAIAANGAIGYRNALLYHLRADLRRFKQLTTGGTVVMGRRTFESLPNGPLPGRRNIVLTRRAAAPVPPLPTGTELHFSGSLAEALRLAAVPGGSGSADAFIIGGASVYRDALPLADRLFLTHVHATPPQADTFFPAVDWSQWRLLCEERHEADEHNAAPFTFADYARV